MKILIAPDKFKGSLTATQVCNAIEKGILKSYPNTGITKIPLADGGEGSLESLESSLKFKRIYLEVHDPLFRPINSFYGIKNNTAYIEMALASGLPLLNEENRNPMFTTSLGTGELILDAVKKGVEHVYLFIGGSATNDCGMGIASALGFRFLDAEGNELKPIGSNLKKVNVIDSSNAIDLNGINFTVLTDVLNPLFGSNGAAYIFAPQKGASKTEVIELDEGLRNFSGVIKETFGKDISQIPGSGAAGGIGGGAVAFCNAEIKSGIESILDMLNLNTLINNSDLIITGEGLFDKQTLEGKVVKGIMDRCRQFNKPLGIICGDIKIDDADKKEIYYNILKTVRVGNMSAQQSIKNANKYLVERAEELIKEYHRSLTE